MRVTPLVIPWLLLLNLSRVSLAEPGRTVNVSNDDALRRALQTATAGTRIVIAPGRYRPSVYVNNLRGSAEAPIVIEGADPKNKPLFEGGGEGLHFSGCAYLTLRDVAVRGQTGNGVNVDDGRSPGTAHHITLEGVDVSDAGPKGNHDGIKLSGLDDLVVRGCTVNGWGGEGIDMVGCHRVTIEGCTLRGKPGFTQSAGVQAKGGSAEVVVRRCTFIGAGQRGVNIGGSTDMKVFRPLGAKYEAKDVTVEGCRFVGGMAAVAFVGVDGAVVRYNTIYRPEKWVLRILQETREPGFVPSRNGRFERNLVVFRGDAVRVAANVGPNTDPASFTFRDNLWFAEDQPARSRPDLPTPERGGVYGVDPKVVLSETGTPSAPSAEGARGFGADALPLKPDGGGVDVERLRSQAWFPKAPPLPKPEGQVIRVSTVEGLYRAADEVKPGGTILVADGRYLMPRYLEIHTDGVTMRSESGRRERVILDGKDSRHVELVGITGCAGVTIADLTIQNIRANGFKINSDRFATRVTIRNCVIHNIWERGVKGPAVRAEDRTRFRPSDCRIEFCLFYNDHPKRFEDDPADTPTTFDGNYVGGVDAMYARRWTICDNVFVGIQGRTRAARGAVFLWQEAEDCVVERNVIIDCDAGVCLGNSFKPADVPVHATRCVVRNNFVTRCPEQGILADYTRDCRIVHNTVHDPDSRLRRLVRLVHGNDGLVVGNNLLSGPAMSVETTSQVRMIGNVTRNATDAFVDAAAGDLHLKGPVEGVVDAADPSAAEAADIDGRPREGKADVGADETNAGPG